MYSQQCGIHNLSWWKQEQKSYFVQQTVDGNINDLDLSYVDMLVYVKMVQSDVRKSRKDFWKYIGGQSHVCCERYDVPLITCCDKEAMCYQKLGDYYC